MIEDLQIEQLIERYNKVIVRELWSERIGEFVTRSTIACAEAVKNPDVLYVYYLSDYNRLNVAVYESLLQQDLITIVPFEKRQLWSIALKESPKVVFEANYKLYERENYSGVIDTAFTKKIFSLSDERNKQCKTDSEKMKLRSPYVCMSNRDDAYMYSTFGYGSSFRNSKFETRKLAIRYLLGKGILSVRMGRLVEPTMVDVPYIRYAEEYYDEFMDLYLSANCKFWVGDTSGVMILAAAYGRPLLFCNAIMPQGGDFGGGMPNNKKNLMIFKKYYDVNKKRFLNLKEMIDVQYTYPYDGGFSYEKAGIKLIDNTAEEILDAVREMNEILDGTYVKTNESENRQKAYWRLVQEGLQKYQVNNRALFNGRVGDAFLKNNSKLFFDNVE